MAGKVPFDTSTAGQCLCPGCPVQMDSECVARQRVKLEETLRRNQSNREEIPGAYCGSGKATCSDLDPSQICLCAGCPVFEQYDLAAAQPEGYYCRDGAAQ